MAEDKNVIIVVPVYKKKLDEDEKISLSQLFKILGNYDIAFVMPLGLNIEYEECVGQSYRIEYFDSEFFLSAKKYSRLCTSIGFYDRFREYKYMLIYQLDAFVFYDRLMEFCEKNYDYYGAMVPKVFWGGKESLVGNGGFSLRNIQRTIELLKNKELVDNEINRSLNEYWKKSLSNNEDEYIVYLAHFLKNENYNICPNEVAYKFSVEYNIKGIYKDINNNIPFGCHRWARYKFSTWWPIISQYGYSLSNETINNLTSEKVDDVYNFLILKERLKELTLKEKIKLINEIIGDCEVAIWGLGKKSKMASEVLNEMGINIVAKYDKNAAKISGAIIPTYEHLIQLEKPIIITSTLFEKEIKQEIQNYGASIHNRIYGINDVIQQYVSRLNIDVNGELA